MAVGTSAAESVAARYGTIVVVGGGCFGSYYVRQLARARAGGAITWHRLVVVDRDPACRVAIERPRVADLELVTAEWSAWFDRYLGAWRGESVPGATDAIVPSPLMPHLMAEWIAARLAARLGSPVAPVPLARPPATPWAQPGRDGTHYVSHAEWMCPVNCVEPATCPAIGGPRTWSMPRTVAAYVAAEAEAGRPIAGPVVLHCAHRAYGVGMFDVAAVVAGAERAEAAVAAGAERLLVATVSHCHGALSVLPLRPPHDATAPR